MISDGMFIKMKHKFTILAWKIFQPKPQMYRAVYPAHNVEWNGKHLIFPYVEHING